MCGQVHSQHRLRGMGSRSSTSRYSSRHACRQHGRRHCTETKSFGAEQPPWNGWNKPSLQHQIFFRDNWEMVRSDRRPACQQAGTYISTRGVSRWTRHQQLTSDRSRVPARKEARQLAVRHECLHVGTTAQVMQVQDAWALPHWKRLRSGFSYALYGQLEKAKHRCIAQIEVRKRATRQGVNVHKNAILQRRFGVPPASAGYVCTPQLALHCC